MIISYSITQITFFLHLLHYFFLHFGVFWLIFLYCFSLAVMKDIWDQSSPLCSSFEIIKPGQAPYKALQTQGEVLPFHVIFFSTRGFTDAYDL